MIGQLMSDLATKALANVVPAGIDSRAKARDWMRAASASAAHRLAGQPRAANPTNTSEPTPLWTLDLRALAHAGPPESSIAVVSALVEHYRITGKELAREDAEQIREAESNKEATRRTPSKLKGKGSDRRLKRDIQLLTTLANGIRIYRFRYAGQRHVFVGVMAQDLLNDPRYQGAVRTLADGSLVVDYSALGIRMVDLEMWQRYGQQALAMAE